MADPTVFPNGTSMITLTDPVPTAAGPVPVRIFYALGIRLLTDNSTHWDDPRVYNPPDQ